MRSIIIIFLWLFCAYVFAGAESEFQFYKEFDTKNNGSSSYGFKIDPDFKELSFNFSCVLMKKGRRAPYVYLTFVDRNYKTLTRSELQLLESGNGFRLKNLYKKEKSGDYYINQNLTRNLHFNQSYKLRWTRKGDQLEYHFGDQLIVRGPFLIKPAALILTVGRMKAKGDTFLAKY